MGDYLDRLGPNPTMGDFVKDIYGGADKLVTDLDAMRPNKRDNRIPETPLEFSFSRERSGKGTYSTTYVGIANGPDEDRLPPTPIFGRTNYVLPIQGARVPVDVRGFRGREKQPDFLVAHRSSNDEVECKLGYLGLTQGSIERGLIGRISPGYNDIIGDLPDLHTRRVEHIGSALVSRFQVVEGLALGMSVEEAFAEMGMARAA